MTPLDKDRWERLSLLLDAALSLAPDARAAWLEEQRARDPALAADVEALLAREAALEREGFLDTSRRPTLARESPSLAGTRLGAYVLDRPVGQGGMGTVWLAHRADGRFEGSAAIKFLSLAVAGPAGERRFRREGSALARLSHPNIAGLLDAGVTPAGQPYLVLEFVDGEPLDAWCDGRRLPVEARLRHFRQVLAAVAHAHAQLIVHRDLKPSNILVTQDGTVKLLDFGIAKLLEDESGEATSATERMLTFEYASPEQIRAEPVSTGTDVYSLGVVLYRLLVGRHPTSAGCRTPAEHVRAILDTNPPSLARAVTPSGTVGAAEAARAAAERSVEPERLRRVLTGDLDTIVAKALAKDVRERYGTVAALADDLDRYLRHEPVSARRPTWGYRAAKFVRRNRGAVVTAAVVALALLGTTAFAARQMVVARRDRDRAMRALQRGAALSTVQEVLGGDARGRDGRVLSAPERIDLALHVLERSFQGHPSLVAEGTTDLALRYYETGDRATERTLLARAHALARRNHLPAQLALADCQLVYSFAYDEFFDSARADLAEAKRALAQVAPSADDPAGICLDAEGQLLVAENKPDSAVPLLTAALAGVHTDPTHSAGATPRLQFLNDLAGALQAVGRTREASRYQFEILSRLDSTGYGLTEMVPDVSAFLVGSLHGLGEFVRTESVLRGLVREQEAAYGPGYAPPVLAFLYGQNFMRMGQLDSAALWIGRAMHDTTAQRGSLPLWAPAAVGELSLDHDRLTEARRALRDLPTDTRAQRVVAVRLRAALRWADGDSLGAIAMVEDSLRAIPGADRGAYAAEALATVAKWALARGDAGLADSLALRSRAAAATDSLALTNSALVGWADLVRARALARERDSAAARRAAAGAVIALRNGAGVASPRYRGAVALRDSLSP